MLTGSLVFNTDIVDLMGQAVQNQEFVYSVTGVDLVGAYAMNELAESHKNKFIGKGANGMHNFNQGDVNRLRIKTPLGSIRGNNVLTVNKITNGVSKVALGAAYAGIAYQTYNGDITIERGVVESGIATIGYKGGFFGAAFAATYFIGGPQMRKIPGYKEHIMGIKPMNITVPEAKYLKQNSPQINFRNYLNYGK